MATGGLTEFELGTEETFDNLCSPCKTKNKISETVKYCVDCSDFFCSGCVKFHDDIPALPRHKIPDKGQISGSLGSQPALPTKRCRKHGHKPVDMYCQEHDVVGCATCMLTDHGSCANKTYVHDYVKKNIKMVDTLSCRMKLSNLVDCLRQSQEDFVDEIERLKSDKNKLILYVKKLREDIDKRLDELEQNTITKLEINFNSLVSKLEDGRKRLRDLMKEAQTCVDNLGSATDNLTQEFVSLKIADTVAVSAGEKLNAIQDEVKSVQIDVSPLQEILALLQQVQRLARINETQAALPGKRFSAEKNSGKGGKISMSPQRQTASSKTKMQVRTHDDERQPTPSQRTHTSVSDSKVSDVKPVEEEQKQHFRLFRVCGVNEYSVRVPCDKEVCNIRCACVLEDGTVVIADKNNQRLKRIDSSTFAVKDWCGVPGYPWQVCCIGSTEVSVACGVERKIVFVDVESKMKVTRQINTGFPCYGVAYGADNLYFSCDSLFCVCSLSGERQQWLGKDKSGQDLSTECNSLALSADQTKLYVADSKKGLHVFNKEGELISQYNGPQLQGARRVCLCQNGGVLVCGDKSGNVLQFTAEGNLIGEVLKVKKGCSAICCLQNDSKLILSYDNCDKIEICNLV